MKTQYFLSVGLTLLLCSVTVPVGAADNIFIGFEGTSPSSGEFVRNYSTDGTSLTQVSENSSILAGGIPLPANPITVGGLTIGDADNDGSPEVLVGFDDDVSARLRSYTYDGTTLTLKHELWSNVFQPGTGFSDLVSFPIASLATGNADNSLDGSNEVFVGFTSNNTDSPPFGNRFLRSYDYSGSVLTQTGDFWGGLGLGAYVPSGLGIGDVDNDGNNEVAIAFYIGDGSDQRFLRFYDYDGTSLTQEGSGSLWVDAGLANYQIDGIDIGDVTGDSDNEIVVAFKHKTDANQRFVRIFSYDGTVLANVDLGWSALHGSSNFPAYGIGVGDAVGGILGDFDNDNDVDGFDFLTWQRDPNVGNLSDWESNFGTTGGGPLAASSSAVPEPATGLLLIVGLGLGSFLPRQRR